MGIGGNITKNNTIKITNSQGQEEEWEEIKYEEYQDLPDYRTATFEKDADRSRICYKKLPPKEVYPKVFVGNTRNYLLSKGGVISMIDKFTEMERIISVNDEDREALKQALAESEKIQSQNTNTFSVSATKSDIKREKNKNSDNIQNKNEEKKDEQTKS